jgi:hypothetical protein
VLNLFQLQSASCPKWCVGNARSRYVTGQHRGLGRGY